MKEMQDLLTRRNGNQIKLRRLPQFIVGDQLPGDKIDFVYPSEEEFQAIIQSGQRV